MLFPVIEGRIVSRETGCMQVCRRFLDKCEDGFNGEADLHHIPGELINAQYQPGEEVSEPSLPRKLNMEEVESTGIAGVHRWAVLPA
jgi:hypothetical protein